MASMCTLTRNRITLVYADSSAETTLVRLTVFLKRQGKRNNSRDFNGVVFVTFYPSWILGIFHKSYIQSDIQINFVA